VPEANHRRREGGRKGATPDQIDGIEPLRCSPDANADASSSLSAIDALIPVGFNWIDPAQGGAQVGFIAQDVQKIFPELVSTTSATVLTPGGTLGLNYIGLIAPLISAVQALATRLSSLEAIVGGFAHSFSSHQITTDKLCVTKPDGTLVCVTGTQLASVLAGSSQQSVQISGPSAPIISGTSTPPLAPINTATSTATSTLSSGDAASSTPPTASSTAPTTASSTATSSPAQ
jgi:hypothetical protein